MKNIFVALFLVFCIIFSMSNASQVVFIGGMGKTSQKSIEVLQKRIPEAVIVDLPTYWPISTASSDMMELLLEKKIDVSDGVILIGHCWGGLIARQMDADNPGLVKKVITIASPSGGYRFLPSFIFKPDDEKSHTPLYVIAVHDAHFSKKWYMRTEKNDGIVDIESALDIGRVPNKIVIFDGISHQDLLENKKIANQILEWIR
jgi:pimeloyl-ACP methyl ester carboxylesterase